MLFGLCLGKNRNKMHHVDFFLFFALFLSMSVDGENEKSGRIFFRHRFRFFAHTHTQINRLRLHDKSEKKKYFPLLNSCFLFVCLSQPKKKNMSRIIRALNNREETDLFENISSSIHN